MFDYSEYCIDVGYFLGTEYRFKLSEVIFSKEKIRLVTYDDI